MKKLLTVALLLCLTACATTSQARCFKEKRFKKLTVGMTIEQVADTMSCTPNLSLKGMNGEVVESNVFTTYFKQSSYTGDNYILSTYMSSEYKWKKKRVSATLVFDERGVLIAKYFKKESL